MQNVLYGTISVVQCSSSIGAVWKSSSSSECSGELSGSWLLSADLRMPLISSQHIPVWVASWMSVWVRPCYLAFTRCLQLSLRMSIAVSMAMNQSFNFKESCPSHVGISWSMVVVRLDCLCVAQRVSVYDCMVLCTGSLLDCEAGCNAMVKCCTLSGMC